jgi:hypothetical protein
MHRCPGSDIDKIVTKSLHSSVNSPLASATNGAALRVDGGVVRSIV